MMKQWGLRILRAALAGALMGAVAGGLEVNVALRAVVSEQVLASERVLLWGWAVACYGGLGLAAGAVLGAAFGAAWGHDDETLHLRFETGRDPTFPWLPPALGGVTAVLGLTQTLPGVLDAASGEGTVALALMGISLISSLFVGIGSHVVLRRVDRGGRGAGVVLLALPTMLLLTLMAVASAPMAGGKGKANRAREGLPDVMLITVDGLRADHLGAGARVKTPKLNHVGRQGVSFTAATTPSTAEAPPVMTVMTGLHPLTSGVLADGQRLPHAVKGKGVSTLAEAFAREGYATAAFVASAGLDGRATGLDRGFAVYDDEVGEAVLGWSALGIDRLADAFAALGGKGLPRRAVLRGAAETLIRYRRWLAWHTQDNTFVWLHLADPRMKGLHTVTDSSVFRDPIPGEEGRAYGLRVAQLDAVLGETFRALERDGLLERTLVAIVGTRGAVPGGGHPGLTEPWTQVPMILYGPSLRGDGLVSERQVRLQDLPATLLTAAGLRKARLGDGVALVGPAGAKADSLQAIVVSPPRADGRAGVAIRAGRWKYVKTPRGGASLYDLKDDPRELEDVSKANGALATRFAQALDKTLGGGLPRVQTPTQGLVRAAKLRALEAHR